MNQKELDKKFEIIIGLLHNVDSPNDIIGLISDIAEEQMLRLNRDDSLLLRALLLDGIDRNTSQTEVGILMQAIDEIHLVRKLRDGVDSGTTTN